MSAYDAIVVGSGPAGATVAFLLAKSGFKTLIADRRSLPRRKICGGLVTAHCVEEVRKVFGREVPPEVHVDPPLLTERVIPPSGRENGFFNPTNRIRNVDRSRFDYWLTSTAVEAGASLLPSSTLLDFVDDGRCVRARFNRSNSEICLQARCLIGADGVYSTCRKVLFGPRTQRTISVIQEYYSEAGDFEDSFYLFFRGDVSPIYAYVVPKAGHTVIGLGVHRNLGPPANVGLARFREWLSKEYSFESRGFVRREGWSIPFGDVAYGRGRVILVGDAGGFCEPFTGEGIYFGIESAKAAAASILSALANGGNVAEVYEEMATPLGRKMEEIAAYVHALTDEERERRIRRKREKLSQSQRVVLPA
jgi:geranylgeranyl reductase family protein